ncbi:hypothetical protein FH972_017290 [Carpinus fangiana]|uniref:Uncharacterized protein n=1 Tax=Carpinus fangiana TaxID=176857 RepID=A0A5N6RM11_9ROSI|nr:hypothetical protein FH972_017290 [Carpinus fangiana]
MEVEDKDEKKSVCLVNLRRKEKIEIEEENIVPLDELEIGYMEIEEGNIVPPAEPEIKYVGVKVVAFIIAQQQTYAVVQATHSDGRLGNGGFEALATSYGVSSMLTIAMWIPIYDCVVVHFFRKLTGKEGGITLLQTIDIRIVLSILIMVVSSLVELALAGLCEAFNSIGQIELYYKEFPKNMMSFAGAFFFCNLNFSSFLSRILVSVVHKISLKARIGNWLPEDPNNGRLEYFYYMIAALEVLNFGYSQYSMFFSSYFLNPSIPFTPIPLGTHQKVSEVEDPKSSNHVI